MVDQIRICPGDVDHLTIDYCQQHDILLEAYSPFGTGQIFANETLKAFGPKEKTFSRSTLLTVVIATRLSTITKIGPSGTDQRKY